MNVSRVCGEVEVRVKAVDTHSAETRRRSEVKKRYWSSQREGSVIRFRRSLQLKVDLFRGVALNLQ